MRYTNKIIEELLNDKNFDINDFAKYLEIDVGIAYGWRRGDNFPSTKYLLSISEYFDYSIEYLIGRTEDVGKGKVNQFCTFKERLKFLRDKNDITSYRMIYKDKVCTSSTYQRWTKNNVLPNVDSLIKLADYFKVTIDYLLGRE